MQQNDDIKVQKCSDCTAARCYISCPRYLTHYATETEFWDWWGRTSPPDFREREVLPPGEPSGKSSNNRRKKRQKKKQGDFTTRYYYLDND